MKAVDNNQTKRKQTHPKVSTGVKSLVTQKNTTLSTYSNIL